MRSAKRIKKPIPILDPPHPTKQEPVVMQYFAWTDEMVYELNPLSALEKIPEVAPECSQWLNMHGLNDEGLIIKIEEKYELHHLHILNSINTDLRPRTEEYATYLFSSFKTIHLDKDNELVLDQISIFLKRGILITFREKKSAIFDHIRMKLREKDSLVRKRTVDFLLYAVLETIIENYHTVLDQLDDDLDVLHQQVVNSPNHNLLLRIEKLKRNFNFIKRQLIPIRDAFAFFSKNYEFFIEKKNVKYFNNLNANLTHLLDTLESDRLELDGLTNINFANQNQRLNEVIKVLTIFSSIFLPLTFIVGIYGMNFDNMPELRWHNGYYYVLCLMVLLALSMIYYFRKKHWL